MVARPEKISARILPGVAEIPKNELVCAAKRKTSFVVAAPVQSSGQLNGKIVKNGKTVAAVNPTMAPGITSASGII